MSDFFQNGAITTFHKLGPVNISALENELTEFSRTTPIALVLPSLYREFTSGALPSIMEKLRGVNYLAEIVLCMDKCEKNEFRIVAGAFSDIHNLTVLWNDGPGMRRLYDDLEKNRLSPGKSGKGRAVWIALGLVLARGRSRVIVMHDCDIVNYDRAMPARLCFPVANPHSHYSFCKGYYSRVTDRMYGRATRLFFTPFIRALIKILGYLPFLVYMDSFRYALAGEIAMGRDLAMAMRLPGDWGLEVGTLAEVYRRVTLGHICQVDIADNYEHKHQPLKRGDPGAGVMKMAIDIAKSIFRTLTQEGVEFSEGFFKTLTSLYLRCARETVDRYENDARINGLLFNRHAEASAVEAFTEGIQMAGKIFWEDPSQASSIPNWHRVTAALPEFFQHLMDCVEEDVTN
jgi:glucosyl-3-phosphoglycerate synthase